MAKRERTRLARRHPDVLRRLSIRYCWDTAPDDASDLEARVILRTMDLGVWEDVLELEHIVGHADLADVLRDSPAGALTPRSWSFWHNRLGLLAPGQSLPPMPVRRVR